MQRVRGQLSPSMFVAIAALVVAMSGTAVAAGAIITRPDQLASSVVTEPKLATNAVDDRKIRDGSVSQSDQAHPILRTRVTAEGFANGDTRPPTERISEGVYRVTFDREDLAGRSSLSACAFSAMAESPKVKILESTIGIEIDPLLTTRPFTVTVRVFRNRFDDIDGIGKVVEARPVDRTFYLTAAC